MEFSKLSTVHIPAHSLTPDEWLQVIEAYATSPEVQESILRGLEVLTRPGISFTEAQRAAIAALPPYDAQREILADLESK